MLVSPCSAERHLGGRDVVPQVALSKRAQPARYTGLMANRTRATGTVALVLMGVAACGSDRSEPAPTAAAAAAPVTVAVPDACAVFSAEQIATGLGQPVTLIKGTQPAQTVDGLPMMKCQWQVDGGKSGVVSLVVENFADTKTASERFRAKFANHSYAMVSDLGDEAIFARDIGNNHGIVRKSTVQWRHGAAAYRFDLTFADGMDRDATEAKLRDIATAVF